MANEKLTSEGAFGAPPPGAPRQVTDGVPRINAREMDAQRQAAAARAAERGLPPPPTGEADLAPFAPPKMTREQQIALIGREAVERLEAQTGTRAPEAGPGVVPAEAQGPVQTGTAAAVVTPPPPAPPVTSRFRRAGQTKSPQPLVAAEVESPDASVPLDRANANAMPLAATREDESIADWAASARPDPQRYAAEPRHQPAASDTDTPSRGIPKAIEDEGKRITGGFGDIAEAQYVPLDGSELAAVVKRQLTEIANRLDDDLRFSMAVTYARVRARVTVTVEAYAQAGFEIEKVAALGKTPVAIAKERCDEVCFVVISEREEMTDAGESVTPPNAMRQEAGLAIPGKRYVDTPAGRMLVDMETNVGGGGQAHA